MSDFWSDKKVLVTGGNGFLGRTVVARIRSRGGADVLTPTRADYDLTRRDEVEAMFEELAPDLVIHLAARVGGIGANLAAPADLYVTNLLMGTFLIEAARAKQVGKTVLIGTICSYPKHAPVPFREEELWNGYPEETNAPYGIAKKALLVHAQANRDQYGQNAIYLLPTNLYGPGDNFDPATSHVIPALIKKCCDAVASGAGEVQVWGTGRATREFLYLDDAADGIVAAAELYDDADPVNLGSGEEVAIQDLAELIAKLTGFEGSFTWDRSKPDGQPRRRVDASTAANRFGFEPRVSLEEGLRRTIDWYRAENPPRASA